MEYVFHNCGSAVSRLWNTCSTTVVSCNTSGVVTINMHSCNNYIMTYFLYSCLSASLRPLASTGHSGEYPFSSVENNRKCKKMVGKILGTENGKVGISNDLGFY